MYNLNLKYGPLTIIKVYDFIPQKHPQHKLCWSLIQPLMETDTWVTLYNLYHSK